MTSSPRISFALVTFLLPTVGACASESPRVEQAAALVSADRLHAHVGALAHDSMRGRDTDDIGFEMARDYVAGEFSRIGLQPIAGDSYLQPFDLLQAEADLGSRITVGGLDFTFPDVVVSPDWLGDRPSLVGEGVFVGHDPVVEGVVGMGDALDGKVAFVLAGVPSGMADEPLIAMRDRAEVELAYKAGALGVVVLNPEMSEQAWTSRTQSRRPTRVLADGTTPSPRATATVGPTASAQILAALDDQNTGAVVIEPKHQLRRVQSWNVVAVLPGSGDDEAEEAIVFTAHLDHVGIGRPNAEGDSIYNGAHDNALGVAKLLESAEVLLDTRLPRSVIFLATGAEESGLLGAWYYVNNPVMPLEKTVAAINHDGGLISGSPTDDVFTWGPEFSTLEEDFAWAADESGLEVSTNKVAPFGPSAGLLYRSDHYPFLISGVPVAYLMPGFTVEGDPERGREAWNEYLGGIHHGPGDNFDPSADFALPVTLTALSVRLAWRLAHAEDMPVTHAGAPIRKTRGTPDGFFFEGPPH